MSAQGGYLESASWQDFNTLAFTVGDITTGAGSIEIFNAGLVVGRTSFTADAKGNASGTVLINGGCNPYLGAIVFDGQLGAPFQSPLPTCPAKTKYQNQWRWCTKCQVLYFAGGQHAGECPAGGSHDHTGSGDYQLVVNSPGAPGQDNWRWCNKCQALCFAGHTAGSCSVGGTHDHTGSGDYVLAVNEAGPAGQHNWRWCNKCQALCFAGHGLGACSAGGVHNHDGSGDYSLEITI